MNVGRPAGLHGPMQDNVIDYQVLRSRIVEDGFVSAQEGVELLEFCDRRDRFDRIVIRTLCAANTMFGGSRGVDSPRFRRLINERRDEELPLDAA